MFSHNLMKRINTGRDPDTILRGTCIAGLTHSYHLLGDEMPEEPSPGGQQILRVRGKKSSRILRVDPSKIGVNKISRSQIQ